MMLNSAGLGVRGAIAVALVFVASVPANAVGWDDGDPNNSSWMTPGNWTDDQVPEFESVSFDFGAAYLNAAAPEVGDVELGNTMPEPTTHTQLNVGSGGVLNLGQLKVGAYTGVNSPTSGASAALVVSGNGTVNARWGVNMSPLFAPGGTNISSTINVTDYGSVTAGTSLILNGGDATINLSGNATFYAPDGVWEQWQNNWAQYNPEAPINPYNGDATVSLSGNAKFIVSNIGQWAVEEWRADAFVNSGFIQGNGVHHFVEGDYRIFMAVPEPGSLMLVVLAVGTIATSRKRRL